MSDEPGVGGKKVKLKKWRKRIMVKDTISLETSLLESKPFVCWHAPKMVRLLLPRDWSPLLMVVAVEELCFHFFL